ncbi:MAG: hypothetical protein JO154_05210 [Chitinophaga sp.]|nr:hypothetical protein [Chitinophaga sp.]MBV8251988.1 hypothetical protein [Chitinophaga sp.]
MTNILKTKTLHHRAFILPVPTEETTIAVIKANLLRTHYSGTDGPFA